MSPAMHGFAVKGRHGSFQCQTWQDDRVKQKAEAGVRHGLVGIEHVKQWSSRTARFGSVGHRKEGVPTAAVKLPPARSRHTFNGSMRLRACTGKSTARPGLRRDVTQNTPDKQANSCPAVSLFHPSVALT